MENSFQTSFIPKKPIVTGNTGFSSDSKEPTSIFMVASVFIFIVMLSSTAGLYVYKGYLAGTKEQLSKNLSKIRDSFDKDTIAELEMYDKRTGVVKDILGTHIVLSPLFESINKLTIPSVQYTKFDHKTSDGNFLVKMSGLARDYKSIALQADVFNTSKGSMFKDVIFSNITKDKNNYVSFDVDFRVDPSILSYVNNISNTSPESNIAPVSNIEEVVQVVQPTTSTTANIPNPNTLAPSPVIPLPTTNNTQ